MKTLRKIMGIVAILFTVFEMAHAGWSDPVPVPGINTLASDYYPSLTADGSKMYFISTRNNNEDIFVSARVDGVWTMPVNIGPPVNSDERDICPSISADGRTLYFVTWNRQGGFGSYDIWYATWNDSLNNWNMPQNPGPNINTAFMEWSPSISHDGNKLYFAGGPTRPGWQGGLDLYVSEKDSSGNWQPPVNLGVNTDGDDYCPSIAPDDTTIYFSSWRDHGDPCWRGGADLFVAYYTNGHWGNVANLCDSINTEYWERSPFIDASGDTLYFARAWPELGITDDILYCFREPSAVELDIPRNLLPNDIQIDIAPNPFNSSTVVRITAPHSTHARISITNTTGQLLLKKSLPLVNHSTSISWDGTDSAGNDLASGIYFVTARTDEVTRTEKLTKLK